MSMVDGDVSGAGPGAEEGGGIACGGGGEPARPRTGTLGWRGETEMRRVFDERECTELGELRETEMERVLKRSQRTGLWSL